MASLVYSIYSPELQGSLMEVCEARPRPRLLGQGGSFSSWLLGTERFLSPYVRHQTPLEKVFKITLRIGIRNYISKSPSKCMGKGNSFPLCQELCKALWTVEADLADGQLLYLTGDLGALGCWEPGMAVLMSPSEHPNLWKTELKIPYGVNFKYNYFIKVDKWLSHDLIWRPGPEFSLSVPLSSKHNGKIVVRDSWMRAQTENPPVYSWGSWMEETCLPIQFVPSTPSRDKEKLLRNLKSDSAESKSYFNDPTDNEDTISNKDLDSSRTFFERDQPVEEPWLVQSSLFFLESEAIMDPDVFTKGLDRDKLTHMRFPNEHHQGTGSLLPEEGSKLTCTEEFVSTVILINSSICTMQRIALLEDEKLVELLLEPVKNNVQCDSVYLGIVTKLVPHMGGAFVNIGISRPSLMDIKHSREPFVFPPFRSETNQKMINGSMINKPQEQLDTNGNEPISLGDVEVIDDVADDFQDDSVQFLHDDFEEHEVEDNFDALEVKESVNDSVVDYVGVDANFEDYFDENTHHIEGENVNQSPPIEMEGQNGSQLSHRTLKCKKDPGDSLRNQNKWVHVRKGTKVIVQVVKEGLGTKGPTLTAYPNLRSRFWILSTRCDRIGVSKKVSGLERTRLRVIAKTLQPPGFGLTVRTVAAGHSLEELQKDLERLLSTWKGIMEHAKSAALAADEGVDGAIPVILHRAMGQTLSVVQDYFNEKVKSMVVDSPRTYHEVTSYLQEIAPNLCDRVELHDKRIPIFDEYGIEEEINNIISKRVPLANGGSLVIEQTEALVSIDVNGGHGMLGQGTSQEKAILDVNLAAAKQIARELRLRDIGGIIVVDFIDMADDSNKRLVYEEVKKAVERDRSMVKVSELSRHGLMEITRKRVRPSVTFMISEPCICCHATGRVEALETSFSKIEHEICRLLAMSDLKADPENAKSWPRFVLRVDHFMCNYLTSGKRTRLAVLSSSLKVWILLKVARGFTRGAFEVIPFTDEEANSSEHHQVAISRLRPTEAGTYIPSKKLTLFPAKRWKAGGR